MNQQIREMVLGTLMKKQAEERSLVRSEVLKKLAALDNVGTELAGTIAAPVVGAGIGGLVGALSQAGKGKTWMHPNPMVSGAGVGAGIGAIAGHGANALGMLIAALVARRKRREQVAHDSKTHLENFIPGVAAYNYTKRLGRVLGGVGETDEQLKV